MRESLRPIAPAARVILFAGLTSVALAAIKISTGLAGHSYALIADGIESLTDVVSSVAVLFGLLLSLRPPDEDHPWGHGKLETLATLFVSTALMLAAALIAWQSVREIRNPHTTPAWFTLPVLVLVVTVKLAISRALSRRGAEHGSSAMEADAWHHLSDALTSGAAFIGIAIALVGGPGWEAADDWAALAACSVIVWNAVRLARGGLMELLESRAPRELEDALREVARGVEGVRGVEKLRARKSGTGYIMDIHVELDPEMTVAAGHAVSGAVKAALLRCGRHVVDVTVHMEPFGGDCPTGSSTSGR